MISTDPKKHSKHAHLNKPKGGEYHRNEWSIIGAPCDIIDRLAHDISEKLHKELQIGFLNADHDASDLGHTFHTEFVDRIDFQSWNSIGKPKPKQYRKFFNHLDLLLINGNHFNGAKQIVLINEKKKESLSKKTDRLTDIRMILLQKSSDDIYDFVMDKITDEQDVQVFRIDQVDKIAQAILNEFKVNVPPLYGLILTGGKSQRMGEDKGSIEYHGKAQREYEAELAQSFCNRVYVSLRKNQDELIQTKYSKIYDSFEGLGPYGGLLSAFRKEPNAAWLTLACDLPYLDRETLKLLVSKRNPKKLATCFYNPETEFPEPLITIWEPQAYPVLLEFLSQGYSCPRKVLINSDIEMVELTDPTKMMNVNDPSERAAVEQHLKA